MEIANIQRLPDHAKELIPGVHFWKNKENEMAVCRVHYLADPQKRDPEWIRRVRAKEGPVGFNVMYEIDFFAMGGQRVFGELPKMWPHIEYDPDKNPIPDHWPRVLGIDWGINHPAAMLMAAIGPDGDPWVYWEYRQRDIIIDQLANLIVNHPDYKKLEYIVADVSMTNKTQSTLQGNVSIMDMLLKGIRSRKPDFAIPIRFGSKSDEAATQKFRGLFYLSPVVPSLVHIAKDIKLLKGELFNLQFIKLNEKALLVRNPSEKLVQKKNDLWDCFKYILLSRPPLVQEIDPAQEKIEQHADPFLRNFWQSIHDEFKEGVSTGEVEYLER